jgi:hypothetical protein
MGQRQLSPERLMRALVVLATFLLTLATPARAADDIAAAQGAIRSQLEAFGRDDAAAAYSYAAPAIRQIFPRAEIFMSMVQQGYAPVYRHKSFEFGEARVEDGAVAQPRPYHRRQRRGMGGALYAWSSNPTAA